MTTTAGRPRPRVDPRMRARLVEVRRARGRRRLRVLVAVVAVAGLAVGAWAIAQSPLLDVEEVTVQGTVHVTPAEVRAAAGVGRGAALVLVDEAAVERRVERLSWVGEAHVARALPDAVRIRVTERVPAAWVRGGDGVVGVVDTEGRVLVQAQDPPTGLPELVGVGAVTPAVGERVRPRAAALLSEMPAELRERTGGVVVFGGTATLRLLDGIEVRLGPPLDVAHKARVALAVLATVADASPAYVDVRVPDAPVTG